jgi:long-chain acyl-CoA synthetase
MHLGLFGAGGRYDCGIVQRGGGSVPADTIPFKVLQNAKRFPNQPAYYVKEQGSWKPTTWAAYGREIMSAAKAMIALGVEPGDHVSILGFNRPEWVIFDVAAMAVGAVPAGIYATNSPEECRYILDHSESVLVLVENADQWAKIDAVRGELPKLRKTVAMKGAGIDHDFVLSWDDFNAAGAGVDDAAVDERLEGIALHDLGTFIYTSGTTGPPKAVMLSHENLAWTAAGGIEAFGLSATDSNLSYLPLSHIAEQMFTIHIPSTIASAVYYAESIDLLAENLKEVRPTIFAGVPRVWEKFYAGITSELDKATGVKARIATWALDTGRKANDLRNQGREPSGALAVQEKLADRLVLSKVKQAIGLDNAKVLATAAAPIASEILEFFSAFFVISEIYGQSEGSGPTTMNFPGKTRFGTVGLPYPGAEVKIASDGEILLKGKNVFLGYYKDDAATREAVEDGWLHSGDLGEFDDDGFLHITGRKKDIIITAGGKNVAPSAFETSLKNHELVSECVVIGDRRKYLTALITVDEEAAPAWMEARGLSGLAHESAEIREVIQEAVDDLNKHFARVEQVKKFAVLPRQLSIEGGELTPTLKVKRNVVADHFAEEIESMYA